MHDDELLEHYRDLDGYRLVEMALFEVRDLRSDAVNVLRTEIRNRDLPRDLDDAIDVQTRELSPEEWIEMSNWLRASPCPHCGGTGAPLNACRARPEDLTLLVGCAPCLERVLAREQRSEMTVGCLKLPFSFGVSLLTALRRVGDITEARDQLDLDEPTLELMEFVFLNAGAIVMARNRGFDSFWNLVPLLMDGEPSSPDTRM